jgi:molecular chaperone HscB
MHNRRRNDRARTVLMEITVHVHRNESLFEMLRSILLLGVRRLTSAAITDRFALLQAERRFDLDLDKLHRRYKLLMGETHPDRHSRSNTADQQAAADHASELTDAYAVLRAPHTRAVHLLELLGKPLNEDTGSTLLCPTFLMEVMDVREALVEAGKRLDKLQPLRDANTTSMERLYDELASAFAAQDMEQALKLTARLQYLQRIEEEIHERMPVK